nr:hypothetical protein [Tanacetum cinerariifolium]
MKAFETRVASPHSTTLLLDYTLPLSFDYPLPTHTSLTLTPSRAYYYRSTVRMVVRTQPTMFPGLSARVTKAMTLSPPSFRKRYGSSYETPSSSASPASSLTLPLWKRYRCTSKPIVDTKTEGEESEAKGTDSESEELEDDGPDSRSEEAASEDQQQQAVSVEDTATDEPLGLGYEAVRRHSLELAEGIMLNTYEIGQSSRSVLVQQIADETPTPRLHVHTTWEDPEDGTINVNIKYDMPLVRAPVQTPASPEWSSTSLPVSPASLTVPSQVATPKLVKPVDEGYLVELGAQLELQDDHAQRLDALPPTLFKAYGRDFTELFARSGAVREEIHS